MTNRIEKAVVDATAFFVKIRSTSDIMRHLTAPGLLVFLSIAIFVLGVAAVIWQGKEWAIVLAVAAGIAGFFFNSAVTFHSQLRDRAFTLLLTTRADTRYDNAFDNIGMLFTLNARLTQDKIIELYSSTDKNAIKLRKDITLIANFYEEMGQFTK